MGMIGVIGGTGLYSLEGLELTENRNVETPFGSPSAPIVLGRIGGKDVAFLPRHGLHHQLLPSEINFRANLWALKKVGVEHVLSVSAVGSLREEIVPGDLVLASQYFDWTRGRRVSSFFGQGLVGHVSTAEPACPQFSKHIVRAAEEAGVRLHSGKTYACVEGPRLGTKAESFFLRNAGCDIVGMTNVPEAFLAKEAQISYATLAIATDYDCWMEDAAQHATADKILELYRNNLARVKKIVHAVLGQDLKGSSDWASRKSLQGAIMTPEASLSPEQQTMLQVLRS